MDIDHIERHPLWYSVGQNALTLQVGSDTFSIVKVRP